MSDPNRHRPAVDPLSEALRRAFAGSADEASPHPDEFQLALLLSGDLDGRDRESVERHLVGCASCAREIIAVTRAVESGSAGEESSPASGAAAMVAAGPGATAVRPPAAPPARRGSAPATGRIAPRGGSARRGDGRRRGRTRIAVALAAGGIAVLLASVGSRMALDRVEPLLLDRLSSTIGREVSIGDTSIALFGGPGLRLADVAIGDDPRFSQARFFAASDVVVRTDLAALLRGELHGSVAIDEPTVRLVRDANGEWNVQTLGGRDGAGASSAEARAARREAARRLRESGAAGSRRVDLTSARVTNGTFEITGRQAGATPVVLKDVSIEVTSADPTRPAAISLAGELRGAADRTVAIRGEIGPFDSASEPRYRFETVDLRGIPMRDIPGAPTAIGGELTFRGSLSSSGDDLTALVARATGRGELGIAQGSFGETNLALGIVDALAGEIASTANGAAGNALLAAVRDDASVSALLAATETAFEHVAGHVHLAASELSFENLGLDSKLFGATASGTLTTAGALDARGTVTVGADLSTALAARAPAIRAMIDSEKRIVLPFHAEGTWPRVRVGLDLRQALSDAASRLDPRALALPWGAFALRTTAPRA